MNLHVIGGGAVKAIVEALQSPFENQTGLTLQTKFSAVGSMRDAFRAGETCDILILTRPLIDSLVLEKRLVEGSPADVGTVVAGFAVPDFADEPEIASPKALVQSLKSASSFYVPDLARSTAGQHIAGMLRALGMDTEMAPKIREFPNGETAMRELARSGDANAVGCTQITEIRMTPGLKFIGQLPAEHALVTTYTAAVSSTSNLPDAARQFIEILTGPETRDLRISFGFQL